MIGIYLIENTVNNKVYIGLSTDIPGRFKHHLKALNGNYHRNTHLQDSWNKHSKESFNFKVLELCNENELVEKEKEWISKFKSYNKESGYNKTYGGEFGKVSDEINLQRIEKLKNISPTKEQREKISKTLTGKSTGRFCCTDEEIEQIIELRKNKVKIEDIMAKYNISKTGYYMSIERYNKK